MIHPCVMLVRNAIELTKRAIESVLAQDIDAVIRVINNDSHDGSEQFLATQLPRVTTQTFRPGLGVSAGWNTALADVFRTWDHCLVVNNDTELLPQTYRLLLEDGGGFVTAVGVNNIEQMKWDGVIRKRPNPDFSAYLIRREVWEKVGPFDESMVLYASDADYHVRMHQAGLEAYTISIPFYHYASGTLKTATETERMQINHQADKDRERFLEKWGVKVGSAGYYELFNGDKP